MKLTLILVANTVELAKVNKLTRFKRVCLFVCLLNQLQESRVEAFQNGLSKQGAKIKRFLHPTKQGFSVKYYWMGWVGKGLRPSFFSAKNRKH